MSTQDDPLEAVREANQRDARAVHFALQHAMAERIRLERWCPDSPAGKHFVEWREEYNATFVRAVCTYCGKVLVHVRVSPLLLRS